MRKQYVWYSLYIIILLLIASPMMVRIFVGVPLLRSPDEAYNLRLIQNMNSWVLVQPDTLSMHTNVYVFDWYHLILHLIGANPVVARFLNLLAGLAIIVLLNVVLIYFKASRTVRFYTLGILAFTPIFMDTFSSVGPFAIAAFLMMLSYYVFIRGYTAISHILILVVGLMDPVYAIFVTFILILYLIATHRGTLIMSLVVVTWLFYYGLIINSLGTLNLLHPLSLSAFAQVVSELGLISGIGLFGIVLGLIGIIFTWSDKRKLYPFYVLFIISYLFGVLFSVHFFLLTAFFIAYFASHTITRLIRTRWDNPTLQQFTLIIVHCGLLFSAIAYLDHVSAQGPDILTMRCLDELADQPPGTVLSHPLYGDYIAYVSNKKPFIDTHTRYILDYPDILNRTQSLFNLRNADTLATWLKTDGIRYVMVTSDMESGLVWEKKGEGLSYLVSNNETFISICENHNIRIYMVK